MTSVLRESTDDSAPVLTAEPSSLINLLKAVLSDGYGTTLPLGWSVMFDDQAHDECVFRSNGGNSFPVKISDGRSDVNYSSAYVTAYESMSDINTGYGPCPFPNDIEYSSIIKSGSASGSTPIPWKIIGDDKGFWFLPKYLHAKYPDNPSYPFWEPHYIGEYTPIPIQNKYNFITLTHHSNGAGYFRSSSDPYNEVLWIMRDPLSGEPGCVRTSISCWHAGSGYLWGNGLIPGVSPSNGKYLYECPLIWQNNRPAGKIPGFYNMLWRASGYNTSTTYYNMSEAETVEFFEVESDTQKMFVFPFRESGATATANANAVHRGSILIGEGFRNVN